MTKLSSKQLEVFKSHLVVNTNLLHNEKICLRIFLPKLTVIFQFHDWHASYIFINVSMHFAWHFYFK